MADFLSFFPLCFAIHSFCAGDDEAGEDEWEEDAIVEDPRVIVARAIEAARPKRGATITMAKMDATVRAVQAEVRAEVSKRQRRGGASDA